MKTRGFYVRNFLYALLCAAGSLGLTVMMFYTLANPAS